MDRLDFCSASIIGMDVIEVIPRSGIEITPEMLSQFFEYADTQGIKGGFSILLNKATKYSYTFEALVAASLNSRIKKIAIISYDDQSTATSDFMAKRFNKSGKDIAIFNDRESALEWL